MKIFILCAGKQTRWTGYAPKQFISVNGESLIERTLRLTGGTIVSHRTEFNCLGKVINPSSRRSACATLRSCSKYFEDRNIILLGDVYYTEDSIELIKSYNGDLQFFSDGQDIFAISFSANSVNTILSSIQIALKSGNNNGRLWEIYREIFGIETFPMFQGSGQPCITYIEDETQDFDTEEDYRNYLNGISKNIIYGKLQVKDC